MDNTSVKDLWKKFDSLKEELTKLSLLTQKTENEQNNVLLEIAKQTCPKKYYVQIVSVSPLYDADQNGKIGIFAVPTEKPVSIGDSEVGSGVEIYCDEIDKDTRVYTRSRIEKAYEFRPDEVDKLHNNTRGLWEELEINNDEDIEAEISVEDI